VNLYEQQALNRRRTVYVMVGFVAFLLFLGLGFDFAYLRDGEGPPVPIATTIAVLYGGGSSLYSYFKGDRAVLGSAAAQPVAKALETASDEERLRIRQFQNVVEEMSIAAGLPMPQAYVMPDPDPNAFATGRDPEHASIAVTDGLLRALNREQLQGVVAHEMAHIQNYDIRLMTIVAALVGAIALIADFTMRGWRGGAGKGRSSRGKKGGGGLVLVLLIVWGIAVILAPLIARLLATMVSRRREYLADATGAELTRNPAALADALEMIEHASGATKSIKHGSAHLCIADPLERKVNQKEGRWANLMATHPPMQKRIEALRAMAFQSERASTLATASAGPA
jgi:heat shock protein HtpX